MKKSHARRRKHLALEDLGMLLGSREPGSLPATCSFGVESIGFETEFDERIFDLLIFALLFIARQADP